ncbi:hypothetical protein H4582DRAFT_2080175 [Lactarius indigo]|nr:hypothetical protein H4582DRAFT_2080175 [Lactarius indigo]
MADRVTRASNANAHPGFIDCGPPRWSSEKVKADKQDKAAAKVLAEKLKAAKMQSVAELEKSEKRKTKDRDRQANNPVDKALQPRAKQTRDLPETVNKDLVSEREEDSETPVKRPRKSNGNTSATNLEMGSTTLELSIDGLNGHGKQVTSEDDDPKFPALIEESESSGSEYKAPVGSDESESDTELDEGPELEGEEPDTNIRLKTSKKQKKGQIAREQISAAAAINDEPSPFVESRRPTASKSGQTPGPALKHARTSRPPSGLALNWQKVKRIETPALISASGNLPGQRSGTITSETEGDSVSGFNTRHHSLSRGGSGHLDQPPSGVTSREPDSNVSYGYGGFVPDDEGLERHDARGTIEQDKKLASKYKSITKVREIHLAPSLHSDLVVNKSHKKKEISYENLPQGTKNRFKRKLIPLALDTTGALKPWNTPGDDTIVEVWNIVFGEDHPIDDGDTECYRFVVAKTLVKRAISSWLHKFADTAEKALSAEFARQGLQTQEERATFVQSLLGDADDMSDKKRPFIWESTYDDPSAQQEGIFQGRLVARTFFEHVQIINGVDVEDRVQEKPIGALIYSIQAVHRALLYSMTGTLKLPMDKKSAEFSKTNWGDHTLITPRGEKVVKRASVFLNKISTLKDQQWDDIFKKALAFHSIIGKQWATMRDLEVEMTEIKGEVDTESDDNDLLDPRYDIPARVE